VISVPEVSDVGSPVFNVTSLAYELFPRLPPLGATPGRSWVDTISYGGEDATGSLEVTWVGTSNLVGDTVMDGRLLTLVRIEAEVTIEVAGNISGMEVTQTMAGPETGFYLWNRSRGALVEQEIERELSGSVRVGSPSPRGPWT